MIQLATNFINSEEFIDSFAKVKEIDEKFVDIVTVVRDNVDTPSNTYFEDNFDNIFSPNQASAIVNSDEFRFLFTVAGNSIIASAIAGNIPSTTKSLNVFIVYALHLIEQLASNSLGSEKINDSTIIIPKDIFPLPPVNNINHDIQNGLAQRKKNFEKIRKKVEEVARIIEANNNAIKEISQIFEKSTTDEIKNNHELGTILIINIDNN